MTYQPRSVLFSIALIVKSQPAVQEICVERVKGLRFAAESGHYDAVFQGLNDAMTKPATTE